MKQEAWMPLVGPSCYDAELDFLCENVGDAQENLEAMWQFICSEHPELPPEGFANNDNLGQEIA